MLLGPFDEVSNDQEVAGEFHALDDAQFEFQPLAVILLFVTCRHAKLGEAHVEPLFRLPAKLQRLGAFGLFRIGGGAGEARQDRLAGLQNEGAASSDLDRILQRFRQIGEELFHLRAALQVVIRGESETAVVGDNGVVGDRHQRVVGIIIVARREEGFIGRDQRKIMLVGKADDLLFVPLVVSAVPLQLDIKPVPEDALQRQQPRLRRGGVAVLERHVDRPGRGARQRYQAFRPDLIQP